MYGINVVQGFSGSVVISILVAAGFSLRNITDDKRNLASCGFAATSKKEGLRHSHFSFANIS